MGRMCHSVGCKRDFCIRAFPSLCFDKRWRGNFVNGFNNRSGRAFRTSPSNRGSFLHFVSELQVFQSLTQIAMEVLAKIVYSGFTFFLEDILNNIITAICNLVENPKIKLIRQGDSTNRANSMGDALEEYIKDVFAGTVDYEEGQARAVALSSTFSYLGNKTNPPDSMLRGGNAGDAIEVKKIENQTANLALNSSYPKCKLYADSQMISKACRECEQWTVRDMIYAVGVVKGDYLKSLAFVYGEDYCAEKETYERIKTKIKEGVETIDGIEFTKTKELGHINKVDPLGITYLRVRGMWGIENPFKVFNYVYEPNFSNAFNFMCIINDTKFNSFENISELYELARNNTKLEIRNVRIKNPSNPAELKEAKLITFFVGESR